MVLLESPNISDNFPLTLPRQDTIDRSSESRSVEKMVRSWDSIH